MGKSNLFHDRYFLERLLGRGNFSEVWLAKDTKTDLPIALKIYAPATGLDDQGLNIFAREFALVVNANHKNLLKPLHYDSFDRKPYLVLPFCKNGSVITKIGIFSEEEAWTLLRDIASGLAWLHSMNPPVIHQDIKPDNIMIGDNGEYLITDFGISTHLKSTLRKSMSSAFSSAGTIAYMAPERFGKDNTPIMANDIYSLGATVFELLSGDTPFGEDGGARQKKGADDPELKGDYSDNLKKTISKCLHQDPWRRPTAEQLEKYAETALRGEKIKFVDESTFFQNHKKIINSISTIFIVVCVIVLLLVFRLSKEKEKQKHLCQIEQTTDSLVSQISNHLEIANSQIAIGDLHNEGFETSYIAAFQEISEALKCANILPAEKKDNHGLIKLKHSLIIKMSTAYKEFIDKAQYFSDDTDVSFEFQKRADNILNCIGKENIRKSILETDQPFYE